MLFFKNSIPILQTWKAKPKKASVVFFGNVGKHVQIDINFSQHQCNIACKYLDYF